MIDRFRQEKGSGPFRASRSIAVGIVASAMLVLSPLGASASTFPDPAFEALGTAFEIYDEVRDALAADRAESLPLRASRLAALLRQTLASAEIADPAAGLIEAAALQAESIAEAKDLGAARDTFGELSHRLMVLAEVDPRLTDGWHAFVCPMAPAFQKWIQPTDDLDNPYMGLAMPKCGTSTDWSIPALTPAAVEAAPVRQAAVEETVPSSTEPVFKPGIPGLKMVDVRDHKFLWRELEALQIWERGDRITIAEFRSKAYEKTAHFLGFEGAEADGFAAAAAEAVGSVRASFLDGRMGAEARGEGKAFSANLASAVERVTAELYGEPRHELFAPTAKTWLFKLAFGPRERKEARETTQQAGHADSSP